MPSSMARSSSGIRCATSRRASAEKGDASLFRGGKGSRPLFLAADVGGGVLAVDPRAGQLLVVLRLQQAALLVALPVVDLLGLLALVAALLPALGPAGVGLLDLAHAAVPVQRLALAVALDAHRHRGEGGGAQLRRAPRLAVVGPHAAQE